MDSPEMGVAPGWLVAWSRINDLSGAIMRQCVSNHGDTELVEVWAKEIILQCKTIQSLINNDKSWQLTKANC